MVEHIQRSPINSGLKKMMLILLSPKEIQQQGPKTCVNHVPSAPGLSYIILELEVAPRVLSTSSPSKEKEQRKDTPHSFRRSLGGPEKKFHLHHLNCNLVMWPHLAARDLGPCSLLSWWPCGPLISGFS